MRKITRRLTAAVLSACMAFAPLGAFAEQPQIITAQVQTVLSDGTQLVLPVQSAITSTGKPYTGWTRACSVKSSLPRSPLRSW